MSRKISQPFISRPSLLLWLFLSVYIVFVVRLFFIQVVNHREYKAIAQEQYWDEQTIPAKRGDIISREGSLLASTQIHYLLYAEPKIIGDKKQVGSQIADLLAEMREPEEGKKAVLKEKLSQKIEGAINPEYYWIALIHDVTPPEREKIEEMRIKGVGFEDEPVRYYPEKSLASHVLGYVADTGAGDKKGYFGIEGKLNMDLQGRAGRVVEEKDAVGKSILVGGYNKILPSDGRNVRLSIDRSAQYIVEKMLKAGVENYDAVSGSVIVMDPLSGEVLALANYPDYDPSDFSDLSESAQQQSLPESGGMFVKDQGRRAGVGTEGSAGGKKNASFWGADRIDRAVSETYEPGSVMKPVTVSAAIDMGKVSGATTYEDSGPVNYSGHWIDNWDGKHWGTLTVQQLLQKSNNIGAAWVGHIVGAKSLAEYLKKFGFGSVTGIDLEGEDTGAIRDYEEWRDIDLATISFGQGVSATPLQVLSAFNVFANGGLLVKPKIVLTVSDGEKSEPIPTKVVHRVLSQDTARKMHELLIGAVAGGESKYFNLKEYTIAGKTGTAQIPVGGSYDPNKTNTTFVGYMAVSKRFSMIVKLKEPTTSIYAAETAVPLWMGIARELVKCYGVAPDLSGN